MIGVEGPNKETAGITWLETSVSTAGELSLILLEHRSISACTRSGILEGRGLQANGSHCALGKCTYYLGRASYMVDVSHD